MNIFRNITAVFILLLSSCSLEYYKSGNSENTTPEFIFNMANFSRYESGNPKFQMSAEKIEQYKSDGSTYAKNTNFKSYNSKSELEAEGFCGLLEAKTNTEKYKLFNDIYLNMISEKMEINAQRLFFDKKSEQITSDFDSEVTLKKDNFAISGTGFSGSSLSRKFSFDYNVSGTIQTGKEQQ